MAILDSQLTLSSNQSLAIAAPGAPSTGIIDFAGVGVGNAPPNWFGVSNAVFGEDIGIGDGVSPPKIMCIIGTAFAGSGATLNVQLQESIDSGVSGTPPYSPNAWTTIAETGALTVAQLAGALTGNLQTQKIAEFTIPPRAPGQNLPRFFRLNYLVVNTFTAGTIAYAGIATGLDDTPTYPASY